MWMMSWSAPCPRGAVVSVNETNNLCSRWISLPAFFQFETCITQPAVGVGKCLCEPLRVNAWNRAGVQHFTCLCAHVCNDFICDCVKVCVRNMSLWGQAVFLPQKMISPSWSSGLMCLAFFRVLCAFVCVWVCLSRRENIARSEPAASPVGLKFACFPPICSTQPKKPKDNTAC